MLRICRIALCSMVMVILLSAPAFAETPVTQNKETQQAIAYLIEVVTNSHLTFIRNGKKYSRGRGRRTHDG